MAGAGTSASDCHLDRLAISIEKRFEGLSPPSDCCIFTVPERLWRTNKKAYTPSVVAIGPYHRLNPSLMPMEDHKLRYLQNFLQHNQNYRLRDYIERVKSWEDEARDCYDKQIGFNSDQFSEMMLLDGIFAIQLFLMSRDRQRELPNDRIFGKPWMLADVCQDMALLENQMPFFVIQRLFYMAFGTRQKPTALLELACSFFLPGMGMEGLPELAMESEVKHLVDVIRLLCLQSARLAPNESNIETKFPPSATELLEAGVKLRRGESECLFDIEFENRVLKIPQLCLGDGTESYLRNIIAFEQCYHRNRYLIDYMVFMNYLVDTPGDAKLLIDKGIIRNWLSNKEAVADLINALGEEATPSEPNYYFNSLSHELVKHCEKPRNKWKATFKRDYCSSPWVVISVIAAVMLLLLTVVQAVCSLLSLK